MSGSKGIAYIGVGSNRGNPLENCRKAIQEVASCSDVCLLACSSFYRTEPWGYADQESFINGVFKVGTGLSPHHLLSLLRRIEEKLKKNKTLKWGPRTIDLDILFFNDQVIEEANLRIPHPLLHLRRFVLEPLHEVAPSLIHPVLGRSVYELLTGLADEKGVVRIT
jgi:2-amino-4-hydroxy-6-hydroxymethyldihydropteridine diphosphokinase